jgi:hypothetical protein
MGKNPSNPFFRGVDSTDKTLHVYNVEIEGISVMNLLTIAGRLTHRSDT